MFNRLGRIVCEYRNVPENLVLARFSAFGLLRFFFVFKKKYVCESKNYQVDIGFSYYHKKNLLLTNNKK